MDYPFDDESIAPALLTTCVTVASVGTCIALGSAVSKKRKHNDTMEVIETKRRIPVVAKNDGNVITLVVGQTEFVESKRFLCYWFDSFRDTLLSKPKLTRLELLHENPKEWELVKSVLDVFSKVPVDQDNYHILLKWFVTQKCQAGLSKVESIIKTEIVDPFFGKTVPTPEDVHQIVTVLQTCVDWQRTSPKGYCTLLLSRALKNIRQPVSAPRDSPNPTSHCQGRNMRERIVELGQGVSSASYGNHSSFPTEAFKKAFGKIELTREVGGFH